MGDFRLQKILEKKRDGGTLTSEEIDHFVKAVTNSLKCSSDESIREGESADRCQIGAMLMAMYLNGLNDFETNKLTLSMRDSGRVFQWSDSLKDRIVDKHSTGGVGDKISLVLAPALAACGLLIPMISGRSLAHTGGTLDKLESIKGCSTTLQESEIMSSLNSIGCCIVGQTDDCVPADKVLYECRDLTCLVNYPPFIIASIVSKKLSENPTALVYDVKYGRGSSFTSKEEALETAKKLVKASQPVRCVALLTSMEAPLGRAVGDSLEVLEAVECLKGGGPEDIVQLVEALGGELLHLTIGGDESTIRESLKSGKALNKFYEMLILQKADRGSAHSLCYGDAKGVFKTEAENATDFVYSGNEGYITSIDPLILGNIWKEEYTASLRNAGVGFVLKKTVGDKIKSGEIWLQFFHHRSHISSNNRNLLSKSITVSSKPINRIIIDRKISVEDL